MKLDNLSHLPEWDDEEFDDEKGEKWKTAPTRNACKALYQQWQQMMVLLEGALHTMKKDDSEDAFPDEYWEDSKQMLLGDGYEAAVKIKSSESGGLYVIRMENAAIIRKNVKHIYSSLLTFMHEDVLDESYVWAIRKEIDAFRELFKQWVSTFQKDEFEDEWGLFV